MTPSGRYKTKGNIEDQYYPKSHILLNKLDLTNEIDLQEAENQLLEQCVKYFSGKTQSITSFNSSLICKIHQVFLSKLYQWAGKYRTVDISKGNTRFAVPKFIPKLMTDFDKHLAKEDYLFNLDAGKFIERLAYYKCELLAIHPFREGNGRTIRLFCDLLAIKNGYRFFEYPTTRTFIKKYIAASISGVVKADYKPMQSILKKCFRA
jgi:cell filamentation protein